MFSLENDCMKLTFTLACILFSIPLLAQVDTVVLRQDSTFQSKFHRKLHDRQSNVRFHLDERGNIRDIVVYLATLEELNSPYRIYAVRIDQRLNRNLFTEAPAADAEYIDEDELSRFIGYLQEVRNEVMKTDYNQQRYTEYRYYTRAGIMLECYTGASRWRCVLHYEIGQTPFDTYINNPTRLDELLAVLQNIQREIALYRKNQ